MDHTVRFYSGDLNGYFNVLRINTEHNSFTLKVDGCFMDIDQIDNIEIDGVKIKDISSLRSALSIAQARVSECSDREALLADNVELRSALAEKTAQVERLREALVKIEMETWAPYEERM